MSSSTRRIIRKRIIIHMRPSTPAQGFTRKRAGVCRGTRSVTSTLFDTAAAGMLFFLACLIQIESGKKWGVLVFDCAPMSKYESNYYRKWGQYHD